MKRKKNLFLKLTMVLVMAAFIVSPSFSALAAKVDGFDVSDDTTCSGGTVNTNYYLFLEDIYSNDGSTYGIGSGENTNKTNRQKNFQIGSNGGKVIAAKEISITSSGGGKTNTSSWSLNTFYDVYRDIASGSGDENRVKHEGTYHYSMAKHWVDQNGNIVETEEQTSDDFSTAELAASTFKGTISVEWNDNVNNIGESKTTIGIKRDYSGASVTGVTPVKTLRSSGSSEYYWHFYHPALYMIQYCATGSSNDPSNPGSGFKVEYDPNGGYGAPDTQVSSDGSCLTISSTKPSLSGSKFLGWSTNPSATSADATYNPGKKYCGPDLKLYAVWSSTSATANPKTGIKDYAIAVGLISAITAAGLLIARKKKLFKQV